MHFVVLARGVDSQAILTDELSCDKTHSPPMLNHSRIDQYGRAYGHGLEEADIQGPCDTGHEIPVPLFLDRSHRTHRCHVEDDSITAAVEHIVEIGVVWFHD